MSTRIRILIADDHPLVITGMTSTLALESDMEVVGTASNGQETVTLSAELKPEILLLDLSMPGMTPIEIIMQIHECCPDTRILIVSAYDDDAYVRNLIEAEVAGYLLKDEAPDSVVGAIRAVHRGATWFSRSIMQKLMDWRRNQDAPDPLRELTDREREILLAIAKGWDNARIAHELHLAEQTVRNYASRVYEKIGVNSRAEAIVWARERGMGTTEG